MRGRAIYLLLALLVGMNATLLYDRLSRPGPRGRPGPPPEFSEIMEHHVDRMTGGLGLDESQAAQIRDVLDEQVPRILEQRERVDAERQRLADLYVGTRIDTEAFREQLRRVNAAQSRLDELVGEAMLGEALVLTPEQRRRHVRAMPWGRTGGPPPPGGPPGGPRGRRPPPRRPPR